MDRHSRTRGAAKTRAIKLYVADKDPKNWDEYGERLPFAINTAQDCVRGDTPLNLTHGWNTRSTLEATLPLKTAETLGLDPKRWLYNLQRQNQQARATVN